MKESWPARVVATESYGPNVEIARRRLEPAGARVVELADGPGCALPFADCSFALVLNRHGSLHVAEVSRVLAPGGTLLTEQVHDLWAHDLLAAFGAAVQHTGSTPERYAGELRRAGMTIGELQDWRGHLQFTDVGAIVYYLKAIPWLLPGFSVDSHYDHLVRLQKRVEAEGPLVFEAREYLIRATRSR